MVAMTTMMEQQIPSASGLRLIRKRTRMLKPDAIWKAVSLYKITILKFM